MKMEYTLCLRRKNEYMYRIGTKAEIEPLLRVYGYFMLAIDFCYSHYSTLLFTFYKIYLIENIEMNNSFFLIFILSKPMLDIKIWKIFF